MISPWWSIALTGIGLLGLALVFARPHSITGPVIGIAVQLLWTTYAITTGQWGFIASALAYGAVNTYGIHTRRNPRPGPLAEVAIDHDRARHALAVIAGKPCTNGDLRYQCADLPIRRHVWCPACIACDTLGIPPIRYTGPTETD